MKPAWIRPVPMPFLYRIVLFFAWLGFKVFYRHKSYGHEHFIKGGAIIAASHTSFMDPPVVAISWPEEIHFLARETLFKNKLFGGFISRLNAHPISGDASDIAVFRTIGKILESQQKVLLFPEGKRSLSKEIGEIKPGTALLAMRYNGKIIPAYIDGTFEVWSRKRKFPKLFGKTRCVFGTPIDVNQFDLSQKKEAQKLISLEIKNRLIALKEWLEKGAQGSPP